MPRTGLTAAELKDAALEAAEAEIRRHGVRRARLTEVARQLGVDHSLLYRFFPGKDGVIDAVSARWLVRIDAELQRICDAKGPATRRIEEWFVRLYQLKREKVSADPELYGAFNAAAERARPFVARHLATSRAQIGGLVAAAIAEGQIRRGDPGAIGAQLSTALLAFHHPRLVLDSLPADRTAELKELLALLLRGLRPGAAARAPARQRPERKGRRERSSRRPTIL